VNSPIRWAAGSAREERHQQCRECRYREQDTRRLPNATLPIPTATEFTYWSRPGGAHQAAGEQARDVTLRRSSGGELADAPPPTQRIEEASEVALRGTNRGDTFPGTSPTRAGGCLTLGGSPRTLASLPYGVSPASQALCPTPIPLAVSSVPRTVDSSRFPTSSPILRPFPPSSPPLWSARMLRRVVDGSPLPGRPTSHF
jgi:hypothetical protein